MTEPANDPTLPKIDERVLGGFRQIARWMLQRNFHVVAVERQSHAAAQSIPPGPLIVFGNHPGWWDPLVAMHLAQQTFPQRRYYAPIDAQSLQQYRVFARLGYYGIELHTAAGATAFLKKSLAILNASNSSLWITPEGRFADPRDRSATMMPGVAHVAARLTAGTLLPLAIEYAFWEERRPCVFLRWGEPISIVAADAPSKAAWSQRIERALRSTQDELAALVIERDDRPFEVLLRGQAQGPIARLTHLFRRLRNERVRDGHGKKFQR